MRVSLGSLNDAGDFDASIGFGDAIGPTASRGAI
jgi:hypothetical protein